MSSKANRIKARNINPLPFDPTRDEIDEHRVQVAQQITVEADWALVCLRERGEFQPVEEITAQRWKYYLTGRNREAVDIWTQTNWLFHFNTHARQFSIDDAGKLWSRRYFRDWDYRKDIIVYFPLGNITDCFFGTYLLEGELLPELKRLSGI